MKKKILAMILCFALIIPAAACGSASAGAVQEQAEEAAEQDAASAVTEADLSGKLASLDKDISGLPAFKEMAPAVETSEEDARANEELPSLLKINDSTEVEAALQSNMQALSYGGVIFQVPAAWQWETTPEGYLATYPQDGHCYLLANGTGIRGYDTNSILGILRDTLSSEGQTVSEFNAGGKSGLKSEYYGTTNGINVKITDYYFLPNDTWLLQMRCVSTTTESFDSILQTIDFTHAVLN